MEGLGRAQAMIGDEDFNGGHGVDGVSRVISDLRKSDESPALVSWRMECDYPKAQEQVNPRAFEKPASLSLELSRAISSYTFLLIESESIV